MALFRAPVIIIWRTTNAWRWRRRRERGTSPWETALALLEPWGKPKSIRMIRKFADAHRHAPELVIRTTAVSVQVQVNESGRNDGMKGCDDKDNDIEPMNEPHVA